MIVKSDSLAGQRAWASEIANAPAHRDRITTLERTLAKRLLDALSREAEAFAAGAAAMREAAANACEEYESQKWGAYKTGNGPERASDYTQGESSGGCDCAALIRALPTPEDR